MSENCPPRPLLSPYSPPHCCATTLVCAVPQVSCTSSHRSVLLIKLSRLLLLGAIVSLPNDRFPVYPVLSCPVLSCLTSSVLSVLTGPTRTPSPIPSSTDINTEHHCATLLRIYLRALRPVLRGTSVCVAGTEPLRSAESHTGSASWLAARITYDSVYPKARETCRRDIDASPANPAPVGNPT
jgi:hypothetical protein